MTREQVVALHCSGAGAGQWNRPAETLGDGYELTAPEHYGCESVGPWTGARAFTLADEAARTIALIDGADRKMHLIGHSYGGVVITEAGNDPKVGALVYIAAFAPKGGESVASLIKDPPPGAPVPPILPPQDGFLFLDRAKFAASFAADVDAPKAAFMADSQVPWGVEALSGAVSKPAWESRPSWYLVASDDKMIPPPAQRFMAQRAGASVVEVAGSHSVYVSQPAAVAALIEKAAKGLK